VGCGRPSHSIVPEPDTCCLSNVTKVTSSKRSVQRIEQRGIAERLEQALYGALGKQAQSYALVRVAGDEDDRNVPSATGQFSLQIQARHSGHDDVENQAASLIDEVGGKEGFCR